MAGSSLIPPPYDWVRLHDRRVELPLHSTSYPLSELPPLLKDQLAHWQEHLLATVYQPYQQPQKSFKELGESLFAWINGHRWQQLHQQNQQNHPLLIQIEDPAWADYPWELLHDGRMWLALSKGLIRMPASTSSSYSFPAKLPEALSTAVPEALSTAVPEALSTALSPSSVVKAPVMPADFRLVTATAQPPLQGSQLAMINRIKQMQDKLPPDFLNLPACHPDFDHRVLEPLSASQLRSLLSNPPDLLWCSCYADQYGWYLETDARIEIVDSRSLNPQWKIAVKSGLKLLLMQDSSSLLSPANSHSTDTSLLNNIPYLIRVRGQISPAVQERYFDQLASKIAQGISPAASHLAAIQHVALWGGHYGQWAHLRFLQSAIPAPSSTKNKENFSARIQYRIPPHPKTLETEKTHTSWQKFWQSQPLSPLLGQELELDQLNFVQQRCVNRHSALLGLLHNLTPQQKSPSLVQLKGPESSGKSTLIQAALSHVSSRYAKVLYIDGNMLSPTLEELEIWQDNKWHPQQNTQVTDSSSPSLENQSLPDNELIPWRLLKSMLLPVTNNRTASSIDNRIDNRIDDRIDDRTDNWEYQSPPDEKALVLAAWIKTPTLLVLEHLEHLPAWHKLATSLAKPNSQSCVLLVTNNLLKVVNPATNPATNIVLELAPLTVNDLCHVFGTKWLNAISARSDAQYLLGLLGQHLLLARLLSRADNLPTPELVATTTSTGKDGTQQSMKLLSWLVENTQFDSGERELLILFSLLPAPIPKKLLECSCQGKWQVALEQLEARGFLQRLKGSAAWQLPNGLRKPLNKHLLASLTPKAWQQACRLLLEGMTSIFDSPLLVSERTIAQQKPTYPSDTDSSDTNSYVTDSRTNNSYNSCRPRLWASQQANLAELILLLSEFKQIPALLSLYRQTQSYQQAHWQLDSISCQPALFSCLLKLACSETFQAPSPAISEFEILTKLAHWTALNKKCLLSKHLSQKALAHPLALSNFFSDQLPELHQILNQSLIFAPYSVAKTAALAWITATQQAEQPAALALACQHLVQITQHAFSDKSTNQKLPESLITLLESQLSWLNSKKDASATARLQALIARCHWQVGEKQQALTIAQTALQHWPNQVALPCWFSILLAQAYLNNNQPLEAWKIFQKGNPTISENTNKENSATLQAICLRLQQAPPAQQLKAHLLLEKLLQQQKAPETEIAQVLDTIGSLYYRLGKHQKSTQAYQRRLQLVF